VLSALRQRYRCKKCNATFTHEYDFVTGKERYTEAFKIQSYKLSIGATVQHSAEITETPYSTAERFFKEIALQIAPITIEAAQEIAQQSAKLILGIDDFAIRKGHNYNTGFHDLRGENLIGIAEGRTINELRAYMEKNPQMATLNPYAVVIDLARGYHSFTAEFFP
jgi:transposase